ncbi:hypothetical protein KGM_208153 [Danaus plexippus plexippus]|uniref:Uncharacterized protein n=1 Tax=Danaus plexippus plexippus TaxID=278856 RepID=A0A212FEN7_DANPL|nr:hypothetical protein KGM_208153 [Danaus plexippus plexippus]
MKKYYQLILVVVCFISIVTLLIYRHEYYRLRYVLEVLNFFGKPGLSEVEFCGPGFNATMLSEILRNSSMEVRETPPLFQQIDENFYSYSSFLRSYNKYEKLEITEAHIINTIVIGKAHVQPRFRCNIWFENSSKPKAGRFSFKAASEIISDYQLYIFECSLSKNLGKPVPIHVRNLETMTNFDDLFNLTTSIKKIPLELLGAHKYSVCRDWKTFSPGSYNETEMQVFQHKFEGAMIKYGQSLVSNKVYRLYTSGQIWEKNSIDNVRDML